MDPLGGGRGVLLPAGCSGPTLGFQPWLRPLWVRGGEGVEGSARRKEGVHAASAGRAPETPGARALNSQPSRFSALGRTALHQGATYPRAADSCSAETASPRPPGGRTRPLALCCSHWPPRAGIGGLQGDGRRLGHRGRRRVRLLLCRGRSGTAQHAEQVRAGAYGEMESGCRRGDGERCGGQEDRRKRGTLGEKWNSQAQN